MKVRNIFFLTLALPILFQGNALLAKSTIEDGPTHFKHIPHFPQFKTTRIKNTFISQGHPCTIIEVYAYTIWEGKINEIKIGTLTAGNLTEPQIVRTIERWTICDLPKNKMCYTLGDFYKMEKEDITLKNFFGKSIMRKKLKKVLQYIYQFPFK